MSGAGQNPAPNSLDEPGLVQTAINAFQEMGD
jgi:hypothetical protein